MTLICARNQSDGSFKRLFIPQVSLSIHLNDIINHFLGASYIIPTKRAELSKINEK